MTRHTFGAKVVVCLAAATFLGVASLARAASLDEAGDIRLGVRVYGGVRVGSEHTDKDIEFFRDADGNVVEDSVFDASLNQFITVPKQKTRSLTFPVSGAGHVRQERYFAEVEFDHDLTRLWREGFGPFALLNKIPIEMKKFRYHVTYRGEGDEIYNIGPSEYRTADQYFDDEIQDYPDRVLLPPYTSSGLVVAKPNVGAARRRLRRVAQDRQRLFQAFLETEVGNLNTRFGRQILAWGEADAFRLLDNINPIDNGFGGFLVSLDERRVPLDMMILNYWLDDLWGYAPFYGAYVEFFGAIDSHVAFNPGIPEGSPWSLPNLGDPTSVTFTTREDKARTFKDARFGFLTNTIFGVPNFSDVRLQFAHYYTYFDTPAVEIKTSRFFPTRLDETQGAPPGSQGAIAIAEQTAPLVQVTGGSLGFGIPANVVRKIGLSGEPQIRAEFAHFQNEPRFTQHNIDPFIFAVGGCNTRGIKIGGDSPPLGGIGCSGGRDTGSSENFVLGIDHNQYIRFLNPNQSFFISTQFFYRHLDGAHQRRGLTTVTGCTPFKKGKHGQPDTGQLGCLVSDGEVLPVPEVEVSPEAQFSNVGATEPFLVRHPVDQYLQTLLIFTSYYSGQINPSLTVFYDWSGGITVIPQVTFSRDPFRFTMSYSFLEANRLKGGSGVSLLRDRDNFLFQFEYVI